MNLSKLARTTFISVPVSPYTNTPSVSIN